MIGEIFKGKNSKTNFAVTDIGHDLIGKRVVEKTDIRTGGVGGYLILEQILLQLFIDRFISRARSLSMALFWRPIKGNGTSLLRQNTILEFKFALLRFKSNRLQRELNGEFCKASNLRLNFHFAIEGLYGFLNNVKP